MKKKLLLSILTLAGMCTSPIVAHQEQQSWLNTSKQGISMATDAGLALSTIWLAVSAIGAYRLSEISKETIPWALQKLTGYVNPELKIGQAVQAELIILGFAGGSLSALSLLLLKKLSWEKKQTQSDSIKS